MIRTNIQNIEENIKDACMRVGRDYNEITLIAVSKTQTLSKMKEVVNNGVNIFGENKVQELVDKFDSFPDSVHWHMIGHLQRNKVKYIIDKVDLIHSVDSIRLAKQIEKEASKREIDVDVLIEVNIANEASKFGFSVDEVESAILEISKFKHINIKGLMAIAPYVENPEENRLYFRKIKELSVDISSKKIDNVIMDVLSMGMTGDYQVAIEEGATMVRVGTGIFGERDYNTQ